MPLTNLGVLYQGLGQYEKALESFKASQLLAPNDALGYANMLVIYVNLNRVRDAHAVAMEAASKKLDSSGIRFALYQLAFLQGDDGGMAEQVNWSANRPGDESQLLYYQ